MLVPWLPRPLKPLKMRTRLAYRHGDSLNSSKSPRLSKAFDLPNIPELRFPEGNAGLTLLNRLRADTLNVML